MNNKRNVYLMYTIVFLQGFVFYGPVATLFRQARGLAMSDIFIIESISWALLILLEVPWGWISDKFGYKKTLIIVNTLFFISKIVFFTAHSFDSFLLERILVSVVLSGLSGCDTALIYASVEKSETQKIFGRYSAYQTLGFLIASVLSTFIVPISLDLTAFLTIFPYGLSVIITFFLTEVPVNHEERQSIIGHFKSAFEDKTVLLFVFSIALVMEVAQAITVFLNQAQYIRSGIDPKYYGLIIAGIQCVRLMSAHASKISKKLGNINAIRLLISLTLASCFLLLVTKNPILSVLGVIIIALSVSVIGPIELDIKNKLVKHSNRATLLSIYSMVGGLLASIGNIFIGKATDYSLGYGFLICIVMSAISLILLVFYARHHTVSKPTKS